MKYQKNLKQLFFAVVMCTISILMVEVPLLLLKRFFYQNNRGNSYIISDPILHHVWRPNLEMLDAARSIPYTLRVNSQSFVEDSEIDEKKPQDYFRVIHLGDSNTQGVVETKFKFVEILERQWNKDLIINTSFKTKIKTYESINSGTTSWSTILYYLALKNKISKYAPDLVIIHLDMTDFGNDVGYMPFVRMDVDGDPFACMGGDDIEKALMDEYLYMTPGGTISIPKPKLLKILIPYLASAFFVDRFLYKLNLWLYRDKFGLESIYLSAPKKLDSENEQIRRSMGILERIVTFANKHGIKVFISTVPHYPQFVGKQGIDIHSLVSNFCDQNNIACMNGYEALKHSIQNSSQEKFYWSNDPTHFNPEGNQLYAIYLAKALKKYFPDNFP